MRIPMREMGGVRPISVRGTRIESIPFSSLPGQTKLFLDHLADPKSLARFYPGGVSHQAGLDARVEEVLKAHTTDRSVLCDALAEINVAYGASAATLANIEMLRDPRTVAVLTGQQTGVFTGPLYTIYKALSAIRSAEQFRERGISAVPVFWMATEDHDLDEVANTFVIDRNGDPARAAFVAAKADHGKPVGSVVLNRSIEEAISEMFDALPMTEFSPRLRDSISSIWSAGTDLGKAFGRTLSMLMGKFGLIMVDPRNEVLKQLAAPAYLAAFRESEPMMEALMTRSEELLRAGYHAQVLIEADHFPLFWHTDDGRRVALRKGLDGTIRPKGERAGFSDQELRSMIETSPGRFSPGVMLRPIVQDHLFPTICYFGGSAEVAYFAQNSEVYRVMGRPVTPVFHRQSFTVVEAKHARTLNKYDLEFRDLFQGQDVVLPVIVEKFIDPTTGLLFTDVEKRIGDELDRLDHALAQFDTTLAANLATRRRKIVYHIDTLRKKFQKRRAETDETIGRRVRAAISSLAPASALQERKLNVLSFLNQLGPSFIDTLYDSVGLDDKGHRVIYL